MNLTQEGDCARKRAGSLGQGGSTLVEGTQAPGKDPAAIQGRVHAGTREGVHRAERESPAGRREGHPLSSTHRERTQPLSPLGQGPVDRSGHSFSLRSHRLLPSTPQARCGRFHTPTALITTPPLHCRWAPRAPSGGPAPIPITTHRRPDGGWPTTITAPQPGDSGGGGSRGLHRFRLARGPCSPTRAGIFRCSAWGRSIRIDDHGVVFRFPPRRSLGSRLTPEALHGDSLWPWGTDW